MNVQSVNDLDTLSDGDIIAVLHMHYVMTASMVRLVNIAYIVSAMPV